MIISGGVVPGDMPRVIVCEIAVTCASAVWMLAPGRKNTLTTPTPLSEVDSVCSMSLTSVVMERSELVTMRSAISVGSMPL